MMKPWSHLPVWMALLAGCDAVPPGMSPAQEERAVATLGTMWRPCDTTASLLMDIRPGTTGSEPRELTKGNRVLFFTADDGVHGRELWKSSGSGGAGTSLVKDLRPGVAGSEPTGLTVVGDRVFFAADDGVSGRELWLSDGTASGTRRVKELVPGLGGSDPRSLGAFEGVFYFSAVTEDIGRELWRSDGTAEGTRLVEDLRPGSRSTGLSRIVPLSGERFCLSAEVSEPGEDLLCGDNASALVQVDGGDSIGARLALGGRLFYIRNDEGALSLRRTDGTRAGVRVLVPLLPENEYFDFTAVGRTLFFRSRTRLWKSDGTGAGTVVVKEFGSEPRNLVAVGGRLLFTVEDAGYGREWWVSDGTPAGTVLFADLAPGAASSEPTAPRVLEGLLFFSADTPGRGREPWVSDGTPAGTMPLGEVAPGVASSSPAGFIRSGWDVFFSAEEGLHGRELWALPFRPEGECTPRLE